MAIPLIGVVSRATNVAFDLIEARKANFLKVHAVETFAAAAAGWLGRKLFAVIVGAAAGEAEAILRLYLVSVPAIASSDPVADTAESRSKVAEVGALERLAVDRSTFSEAAQRARCLEDLEYLTSLVDLGEAGVELAHSQQAQNLAALSRIEERWVALRDSHLLETDEE